MASAGRLYRLGINYNLPTGATYDMLLMSFSEGFPVGSVTFEVGDTPRKITGVQKVAQTFLRVLFTSKGSDVINTSMGTNFNSYATMANRIGVTANIQADVMASVSDAETQVKYILNTTGADSSSTLNRVQVLAIVAGKESITMVLYIITGAGERAQVAIPFPQLDMKLAEST